MTNHCMYHDITGYDGARLVIKMHSSTTSNITALHHNLRNSPRDQCNSAFCKQKSKESTRISQSSPYFWPSSKGSCTILEWRWSSTLQLNPTITGLDNFLWYTTFFLTNKDLIPTVEKKPQTCHKHRLLEAHVSHVLLISRKSTFCFKITIEGYKSQYK